MNWWLSAGRHERGVALPLALFALLMLSGLLLTLLSMGGMEPTIATNLNDTTRARYLAEAGVEWAFDQLILASKKPPQYPNGWSSVLQTGTIANNMTLPGLPATSGTFTVRVRNDFPANDPTTGQPFQQTTGQPFDSTGSATTDNNNVLILTSTGTYNGAARQIQAVVIHTSLTIPGGVSLYGFGINTVFNGNSFSIIGNDTNPDGSLGGCASRWGISVADLVAETAVQTSLSPQQKDNIKGRAPGDPPPVNPGSGQGDTTIEQDATLTPQKISDFVNAVKPYANLSLQASALDKVSVSNLGNTCASNWNDGNCWGTPSQPKIVYIKGTPDPGQLFYAASITGKSTGAGILIIEDGDLVITGDFHWEGPIVITGQYVGLRYGGGGNQEIYGGVVVNETATSNADVELDASGNPKIYYSCQAIANAIDKSRALTRVRSWREL